MNELKQFKEQYGMIGFFRFLFYPLISLITQPIQLIRSLLSSLVLLKGDWKYYPHFNLTPALNNFFYASRALNLKRYGRRGKSPFLGLGEYHLARCFNYTLMSLYPYASAGAVTILVSMVLFIGAQFVWLDNHVDFNYLLMVVGMCFSSTLFYANTFRFQNYNAVGWAFFPIGLYGMLTGNYWYALVGWFGVSLGSFTGVVLSVALTGFQFLILGMTGVWEWILILTVFPAVFKIALNFTPFINNPDSKDILKKVLGAIGASSAVKYKRKKTKKFNVKKLYFLMLYIQFAIAYYFILGELPLIFIACILVNLMNSLFIRFADDQSIHMLFLSMGTALVLQAGDLYLLPFYWLLISPLIVLTGYDHMTKVLEVPPVGKPESLKNIMQTLEEFIAPITQEDKLYFAYADPEGAYEKVYHGYRHLIELPIYLATQRNIRCMPDWWAVFELNYEDAPEIWGTEPPEVAANMDRWESNYAVIYQIDNPTIDQKWQENGFEVVHDLDWKQFEDQFSSYKKLKIKGLKWWLIKKS